ncbi:MAG: amidohydrolase family protein [Acidobacteriales bacterium]|nr:amidohydrolase family protein [Terriglobales bacterium]
MLVRDGRIAAIGRGLAAPDGVKIIDASGRTLMPGLVMMHEHLYRKSPSDRPAYYSDPYIPQIMLAYGTTTARTAGGFDMAGDLRSKAKIAAGKLAGPDLDISIYVDGPKPVLNMLPAIANAADARREVDYWHERGATSVKLWFDTTPEFARAATEEGHRLGMSVAAHVCATFAATAAEAGIDTLEHSLLAAYDIVPGAAEGSCPAIERQTAMIQRMASLDPTGPEVGKMLALLLKHGVAIDPTLAARDEHLCAPEETPPARELALLAKFDPGTGAFCFQGLTNDLDLKSAAFQAATAVRYHRMGGMLVMGTDQGVVPGAMGPRELELMVAAGLSPGDALIAATRNGAIKLGRGKDIGTLEVGKRADFLLVDGKPDNTISDIRRLTHVARDGVVYDPGKLYDDAKGKLH